MGKQGKKLSLSALVLMIFTTIFGFGNTPAAFEQMGYGAIFWYILGAVLFFIPAGLMFAEYGSTFKEAKGGIYSWLEASIGEKWAFIATFMWLASWLIWMVMISQKIWITLATIISGHDTTGTWSILGLNSTMTIGLLAIAWVLFVTWAASRGIDTLAKVSSLGGIAIMALNVILLLASVIILIANHGQLAQPIHHLSDFATSPSAQFQSPIAMISFVIYAIFAYGGLESLGGITDSLDKPEKTFPKGILIGGAVIAIGYSLAIFLWGVSANWHSVIIGQKANLGNITYVLMRNLGYQLGNSLGMSSGTSALMGTIFSRFAGVGMLLAYIGSFFVLSYSPLKSFILGSPKELWPKKMTELNKNGMPANSMWLQAIIVIVFVGGISILAAITHKDATFFYNVLTNMSNVSTTLPYLFLVGAFPFFRAKKELDHPFEAYHNHTWIITVTTVVMLTVGVGIVFTILVPFITGDMFTALWTIAGPIFFGAIAWIFFARKERNKQNL
ncbi:glutamate/gamma-aminobutyrate family transporter YjeM [Pediococcus claussenii]|uniref:Inner membrane transporter yjeM n=1 Tax=Pediococcus claussenii (strain ATCC BAA-344 / DSM 14800 / JCM 18046 / KCTC 3811 / LMG 21948 / P06) TaxID=701521 RepID=G8PD71_PEDCP|nr:glutamate/gamma-aminobutyrate family transporter YjeM [Pediococcus claussenii]AEV95206.1 inner membrane transporter yjeM [Pediococcus claussenii ATCC BAA-344]ANZ70436.1 glutamate/gamma-aminobutyrate family transporter YjeM [Pediococcus claussenii]ANZ72252.1 glutamate/gamma-aminobutyrate family transporter YjeM [Pediococcus claussenii]KRN19611.1 yjeM protein [Pediococcus claussenii]